MFLPCYKYYNLAKYIIKDNAKCVRKVLRMITENEMVYDSGRVLDHIGRCAVYLSFRNIARLAILRTISQYIKVKFQHNGCIENRCKISVTGILKPQFGAQSNKLN